jgi:hypothetical protein
MVPRRFCLDRFNCITISSPFSPVCIRNIYLLEVEESPSLPSPLGRGSVHPTKEFLSGGTDWFDVELGELENGEELGELKSKQMSNVTICLQ